MPNQQSRRYPTTIEDGQPLPLLITWGLLGGAAIVALLAYLLPGLGG